MVRGDGEGDLGPEDLGAEAAPILISVDVVAYAHVVAARPLTHRRCPAPLKDEDWTLTTAQSPAAEDLRQFGGDPL